MGDKLHDDLPARSLEIMRAIKDYGGYICTGSCKQIKKGQLHCRNLGSMLGMGPSPVWEVINILIEKGILERRGTEKPITIYLSAEGEKLLAK